MANPNDVTTVINVKGVSVTAWDRARKMAQRNGETMGSWLSRAVSHLADMEDGPREFPPGELVKQGGNPGQSISPEHLAGLMDALTRLSVATGVLPLKREVRLLQVTADATVREAQGLPPAPRRLPGKAGGKERSEKGKAGRAIEG